MAITAFDAINDALEVCSDLRFEMVPGFATHWPMGAETLIRLGHPERVHEWASKYSDKRRHLAPPDVVERIDPTQESSWRAARGDFRRATDWQLLFEHELSEQPWRDVLARWWPRLINGVAAGLTHGLIRTTHAVRSIGYADGKPTSLQLRELATGLAYWAGMYVDLPGPIGVTGASRAPEVIESIPRLDPNLKLDVRSKGLFLHMPGIAGWNSTISRLAPPVDLSAALSDLTSSFVQVNLAHPNQFPIPLLHTVSAPAALRLMLPHLPQEMHVPSFIAVWRANAALLTTFAPARPEETADTMVDEAQELLPIQELRERAAEHGDEHAMKFTEACLREYAVRPDPRYLLAAERIIGKLPRYFRRGAAVAGGHG